MGKSENPKLWGHMVIREWKRNHYEIHLSIPFFLMRACLKRNILPEYKLSGFYQSLTSGWDNKEKKTEHQLLVSETKEEVTTELMDIKRIIKEYS